jgi:galactokinase
MGDHTDYAGGFVLPMAIDADTAIALVRRAAPVVKLRSEGVDALARISLAEADDAHSASGWASYVEGVLRRLLATGTPARGWQGWLASDVPIGANLSSSAALELAVAHAACAVADQHRDPADLAVRAMEAEHGWPGTQCGIMDQLVVASATAGHAALIDCRSLAVTPVALPEDLAVVVMDTGVRRELTDSAYNQRRDEVQHAAELLGVETLRDVAVDTPGLGALPEPLRRRARHITSENGRVHAFAHALAESDRSAMGRLMRASHRSLAEDYEVSVPELGIAVDAATAQPACVGARQTGGGFGGCIVALVERDGVGAAVRGMASAYADRTGRIPQVRVTRPVAGASVVDQADASVG